ncbi:MAG TPA: ATP-binding protein [Pirellulales bacterium]|nr:ATP-binding protein [Pirellulales bacterium]
MTPGYYGSELDRLRRRLEEAEETIRAIRAGEVDALVVHGSDGEQIYTLEGADHPYRTLIEAMQQGAVSLGEDGTVLYCNRCFADMVGESERRVIGKSAVEFISAPQREAFTAALGAARHRGAHGEFQLLTLDGRSLPVNVALAPLGLAKALVVCMVVTDLTEQKKHQHVAETNHRKDEFLAMLAHELRNPLAPLRGAVELLRLSNDDESLQLVRDVMERQVSHLVRLVDDLLDVSRVMRGRVELKKELVALDSVISHAVEETKPLIDQQGHKLHVTFPNDAVHVNADPVRLTQIIANLLNNAAKYTRPQGEIFLTSDSEGEGVTIRVRDTGIGIAPEMLPHIFDLFSQADRSLDRAQGGLGIGLAIVRMLTEMHGGTIEAVSNGLGQGSEFVLRLARVDRPPQEPKPEWKPSPVVRQRVLVVDDNASAARVLGMLLTKCWGHEVAMAHDGHAALEMARIFRPEVVLLDIGLPGLNGYEVAARLRQDLITAEAMIVALTGYGQLEDRRRSSEAGFDEHLVKPVSVTKLEVLFARGAPSAPGHGKPTVPD